MKIDVERMAKDYGLDLKAVMEWGAKNYPQMFSNRGFIILQYLKSQGKPVKDLAEFKVWPSDYYPVRSVVNLEVRQRAVLRVYVLTEIDQWKFIDKKTNRERFGRSYLASDETSNIELLVFGDRLEDTRLPEAKLEVRGVAKEDRNPPHDKLFYIQAFRRIEE